jgi:hypothetical protein
MKTKAKWGCFMIVGGLLLLLALSLLRAIPPFAWEFFAGLFLSALVLIAAGLALAYQQHS